MKKYQIVTILLSIFVLLPQVTYAECTKEEKKHFKSIEDEYKITHELNKDTKDYNITLYNAEPDSYLYFWISDDTDINCEYSSDGKTNICKNVKPNEYSIGIIGVTETCDEIMKTNTIDLSIYNKYSDDPLCEGIEDFVLCDPQYDKEISREEFESRVETYKKTTQNKQDDKNNQNKKKTDSKIIKYVEDNLFQIIIIIIFVIIVVITIILTAKSIRKSRRLE